MTARPVAAAVDRTGEEAPVSLSWQRALAVWIAVYAVLGQRLYIPRGPGEAVPVGNVVTVVLVVTLLALHAPLRRELTRRFVRMPWLLGLVGVWTALSLAAPIVGYPPHTIFSATVPLALAAFACIGSILAPAARASRSGLFRLLASVGWIQFVVGAMQALRATGLLVSPPQLWLYSWDTAASVAFGVRNIVGRSVGLYVNPNPYSLLGGLLLVLALALPLLLKERVLLAVPAAGIVFLGAGRGVLLALLLMAVPASVLRLRGMDRGRRMWIIGTGAAALIASHFALTAFAGEMYLRFISRWSTLPALVLKGPSADANVAARLDAWLKALRFWLAHPLGTFGPPQMAVSSFTDNDYVTMLLQGGLILLAAYAGTLLAVYLRRRRSALHPALGPLLGLVALSGLTQTSAIFVPALALFWPAVGTVASRPPRAEAEQIRSEDDSGVRAVAARQGRAAT